MRLDDAPGADIPPSRRKHSVCNGGPDVRPLDVGTVFLAAIEWPREAAAQEDERDQSGTVLLVARARTGLRRHGRIRVQLVFRVLMVIVILHGASIGFIDDRDRLHRPSPLARRGGPNETGLSCGPRAATLASADPVRQATH